jgi:hypothetical protein
MKQLVLKNPGNWLPELSGTVTSEKIINEPMEAV